MATPTTQFKVGEYEFHFSRLPVKKSLRGLKLVGSVLLPAMAEAKFAIAGNGQIGAALERAIGALDCLPELLDLFVAHCEWTGPMPGTGVPRSIPTALGPYVESIFSGHPAHTVEFIAQAAQAEYADFFSAQGPLVSLQGVMAAAVSPSTSPST